MLKRTSNQQPIERQKKTIMITRGFPNIISTDLSQAKAWYINLLGWEIEFDSDWFVHLRAPDIAGVELGIIDANHELVAQIIEPGNAGVIITVVVDDVDETHHRATELGSGIVQTPRDLFYGQRRMILRDPDGTLVDVSSECEPSQEFLASLSHTSSQ